MAGPRAACVVSALCSTVAAAAAAGAAAAASGTAVAACPLSSSRLAWRASSRIGARGVELRPRGCSTAETAAALAFQEPQKKNKEKKKPYPFGRKNMYISLLDVLAVWDARRHHRREPPPSSLEEHLLVRSLR